MYLVLLILCNIATTTGECLIAHESLKEWYTFDNNDLGVNVFSNSETVSNFTGLPVHTAGVVGTGITLSNASLLMTMPNTVGEDLGDFTLEFWAMILELPSSGGLDLVSFIDTQGYKLSISEFGSIDLTVKLRSTSIQTGSNTVFLRTNEWHHFALSIAWRQGDILLAVNGTDVSSRSQTISCCASTPETPLTIGGELALSIDELSYYNKALDLSTIQQIYEVGEFGKCIPGQPTRATTPSAEPTVQSSEPSSSVTQILVDLGANCLNQSFCMFENETTVVFSGTLDFRGITLASNGNVTFTGSIILVDDLSKIILKGCPSFNGLTFKLNDTAETLTLIHFSKNCEIDDTSNISVSTPKGCSVVKPAILETQGILYLGNKYKCLSSTGYYTSYVLWWRSLWLIVMYRVISP
mmetsp:Transcript_2377/g.2659  ORF Transcript_2377/g.2659 Transcript_2377/m.2659 type:complete len:411 (-) Transcript_2377:27-1259(-)